VDQQVNNYIAEVCFNINELFQCYLKFDHINLILFVFVGDDPLQQPPRCGYETRRALHERTEATSTAEEHTVNEDMDMDELLKN
jgi:hypothetical protein